MRFIIYICVDIHVDLRMDRKKRLENGDTETLEMGIFYFSLKKRFFSGEREY